MPNEKAFAERRKHKRFKTEKVAFAVNSTRIGSIIDISMDGIAIHCLDIEKVPNKSVLLDILLREKNCYLKGLPAKVIYSSAKIDKLSFTKMAVRRCGFKFGELSPHQITQLENFIQSCSKGAA